jgi:RNA polymerase sigma factor (sigma-70 family)
VGVTTLNTMMRQLRRVARLQEGVGQTDAELLDSFVGQRDEAAFDTLVRRHGPMVFGVCRRVVHNHHDAEDAFQAAFLVLARKASSIRPQAKVANWLHGVAYRTAMKARTMSARRRAREKPLSEVSEPETTQHDQWSGLRVLLDRELNRLSDNYRVPILLCDLEGQTIKEAARQLGWPQGTMASRLARGRKMLAKRLANRGVEPSAGLLAAVVSQNVASPAVPTSLTASTVKAAARIVAGKAAAASPIPFRVTVLMEGVIRGMILTKLRTIVVLLLLMVAVAFAGVPTLAHRLQAAQVAPANPMTDQKSENGAEKRQGDPSQAKNEILKLPRFSSVAPVQALVSLKNGKLVVRTTCGQYLPQTTKLADGRNVTTYYLKDSVTTTEYELKDVKIRDMKGKSIDPRQLPKLLDTETVALIAKDGTDVDPLHLRLIKDGTLLYLLPIPDPVPASAIPPDSVPAVPPPAPVPPIPALPAEPS